MGVFEYSPPHLAPVQERYIAVVFAGSKALIAEIDKLPEASLTVGLIDGVPVVTFPEESAAQAGLAGEYTELRSLQAELAPEELKAVNRARQLIAWQENFRFCGRCGSPTILHQSEPAMYCPNCRINFFPRLDPAIIVTITKGDQILLAHNRSHRPGLFGLVAGFVEGGETIEEAVQREVREEVGIEVKNIKYLCSQSWPFPHALLLGCTAEYASGEISPDGNEITDAAFFNRNNLPLIPSPGSVARRLIDLWLLQ